jgi:SAM-dependent methyltransferase
MSAPDRRSTRNARPEARLCLHRTRRIALVVGIAILLIAALHFPYDVDAPLTDAQVESNRRYYADAYLKPLQDKEYGSSEYESRYTQIATVAAEAYRIEDQVKGFVKRYGLDKRPVLEIGSGRGYLQDMAEDYTGLDISSSVRRFYHKKFVQGSATSLPFANDTFDGAWSIWVLEHVPNPEQALREIRRVMRNDGVVFLLPAWECDRWSAEGYTVRPYSDFGIVGKLVKASIPLRRSLPFRTMTQAPNKFLRSLAFQLGGPTRLHYHRITPNYEKYWVPDSDAVNSLYRYETVFWFQSRGDECLEGTESRGPTVPSMGSPLVVRIKKSR